MGRKIILSILALLLVGCASQTPQPEKIIETVAKTITVEPTVEPTIEPTITPTPIKEDVAKFTRDILDISGKCQASDFLYDFTKDQLITGYKAGIHNVREKCDLMEIGIEIPKYCQSCQDVLLIVQAHAKIMLDGTDLIEKANATLNQDLLTEGLEKFWDADIYWEEVAEAIDSVRIGYNLPEIHRE